MAGKIDAILKLSIVASVLFASSSVGYYYLSYLPHRDARFEPERALEGLRAAAQKRAEREQLLLEQQASEQRALEQQAAEQRQLLEKADRYQACLSHATDGYNESRIAACNRLQEKVIKDHDNCIRVGLSQKSMRSGTRGPRAFAQLHASTGDRKQLGRRRRESA